MFVQESVITGCVGGRPQTSAVTSQSNSSQVRFVPNPTWKRFLDVGLIVLSTPIWLPLMLLIALGVRLLSKGPVLFRQERIGHRGQSFLCLKFRSMRCNADTRSHKEHLQELMNSDAPMVKLDQHNDPRLIPLGHVLRASGMDELPQLFNVIRGDMSLVGPRPCTAYEYEHYEPWQQQRFAVLPGLTGLWQVTGKNKTTFDQMIRLDIHYGRHLSFRRDAVILLKTFGVIGGQIAEIFSNRIKKAQSLLSKNDTHHEEDQETTH